MLSLLNITSGDDLSYNLLMARESDLDILVIIDC